MTPEVALDIVREALWLIVTLVIFIIGPSLIVGLIVSVFQAATQINEQTLSFLPRFVVTIMVLILGGPFMMTKIMDFTTTLITNIPFVIG